jgi:hypothetical protein
MFLLPSAIFHYILLWLSLHQIGIGNQESNPLRYNEIFRKACHNCYKKGEAASLGEALNYVRTIEIDFYDFAKPGIAGQPQEWFVRPKAISPIPNDNCCSGRNDLVGCLKNVRDWSLAHPGHDIITVFLDKKDGWTAGHSPEELDHLLLSVFPREKTFTPNDLKGAHGSARTAAGAGAWPLLKNLNNKFIFVLTGGPGGSPNQTHQEYVARRGEQAVLFVAPHAQVMADVTDKPEHFTADAANWVVFYNLRKGFESLAPAIHEMGFVVRVWGVRENDASFRRLTQKKVHFIALNNFREKSFNGGLMSGPFTSRPALKSSQNKRKSLLFGRE